MMRSLAWLLVFALSTPALAAPRFSLVDARSSVSLESLPRGELRLWLGSAAEACQLDDKRHILNGDLVIHFEVGVPRATKVKVTARSKMRKSFATCVQGVLRGVALSSLAPALVWDGTLRFDDHAPRFEVEVRSLQSKLHDFVVESVIVSALEQPTPCMTAFLTATPATSAVVVATIDTTSVSVVESTKDPGGVVACVKSQLDALALPTDQFQGAKLLIRLLRPTNAQGVGAHVLTTQ